MLSPAAAGPAESHVRGAVQTDLKYVSGGCPSAAERAPAHCPCPPAMLTELMRALAGVNLRTSAFKPASASPCGSRHTPLGTRFLNTAACSSFPDSNRDTSIALVTWRPLTQCETALSIRTLKEFRCLGALMPSPQ